MTGQTLLFFSGEDIRKALPMREAVEVMKEAYARLSAGEAQMPVRSSMAIPERGGSALFMPSALPHEDQMGLKIVTIFDDNVGRGLPRIQALMIVLDGSTGSPVAVMDGSVLTALRTGAGSGAATDLMARREVARAAIFGAGVQGRTQLEAVCAVRPIDRVRVFDRDVAAARTYAEEMACSLGIAVEAAATPRECLAEADVVCTATTSPTPVFEDRDLQAGAHINAVGSYLPAVQEIPLETVVRARVAVDHRGSALAETGDLIIPIEQGYTAEDLIDAEIGEIAGGVAAGRATEDEITLFESVGVAIQDLAAAARILQKGRSLELGTEVSL